MFASSQSSFNWKPTCKPNDCHVTLRLLILSVHLLPQEHLFRCIALLWMVFAIFLNARHVTCNIMHYICAKLLHVSLLVCELNIWNLWYCIWFRFRNVAFLWMCNFIPFHTCQFYTVLLVSLLHGFFWTVSACKKENISQKPASFMSPALSRSNKVKHWRFKEEFGFLVFANHNPYRHFVYSCKRKIIILL